jgi:hypothetical protein
MILSVPLWNVEFRIHVYCSEYVGHMQILDYSFLNISGILKILPLGLFSLARLDET